MAGRRRRRNVKAIPKAEIARKTDELNRLVETVREQKSGTKNVRCQRLFSEKSQNISPGSLRKTEKKQICIGKPEIKLNDENGILSKEDDAETRMQKVETESQNRIDIAEEQNENNGTTGTQKKKAKHGDIGAEGRTSNRKKKKKHKRTDVSEMPQTDDEIISEQMAESVVGESEENNDVIINDTVKIQHLEEHVIETGEQKMSTEKQKRNDIADEQKEKNGTTGTENKRKKKNAKHGDIGAEERTSNRKKKKKHKRTDVSEMPQTKDDIISEQMAECVVGESEENNDVIINDTVKIQHQEEHVIETGDQKTNTEKQKRIYIAEEPNKTNGTTGTQNKRKKKKAKHGDIGAEGRTSNRKKKKKHKRTDVSEMPQATDVIIGEQMAECVVGESEENNDVLINDTVKIQHQEEHVIETGDQKTNTVKQKRINIAEEQKETNGTTGTKNKRKKKKAKHGDIGAEGRTSNRKKKKKHKRTDVSAMPQTNDEIIGEQMEECVDESEENGDIQFNDTFMFHLSKEEWEEMKPETKFFGVKRVPRRRLKKSWTDTFAKHIRQVHPGCVLSFRSHRVKNETSRKSSAPFVCARAVCNGLHCKGIFEVKIPDESDQVAVHCTVKGQIKHGEFEVNRRNVKGAGRLNMAKRIKDATSAIIFNENLVAAKHEEMELGNYTNVPNQEVLRKIVSELMKKEQMHTNIMYELQILKENDELMGSPYIREISLDPFVVLMFSDQQLKTTQQYSASKTLDVYFDATGSVIRKIKGQKRPLLYSLVVNMQHTSVSIADMITTQHTIPRIMHFLGVIKRHFSVKGHILNVRKIETDYSFAMIQASTQVFNHFDLKGYIQYCFGVLTLRTTANKTVLHLCASHMLQDFSRTLKKKLPNLTKQARRFSMECFATLQNVTSLQTGLDIFRMICKVCLSRSYTNEVGVQIDVLRQQNRGLVEDDDGDVDKSENESFISDTCEEGEDGSKKTIKESSPFTALFESIEQQIQDENEDSGPTDNDLYLPDVVHLLTGSYAPIFPLWSGTMLAETDMTRDSNSPVESWFKYLKTNVTIGEQDRRPSKCVMRMKAAADARLRLEEFPGAKKVKSVRKKRKLDAEVDMTLKEEEWNKTKKRKTDNLYHKAPRIQKKSTSDKKQRLPSVMKWGGAVKGMVLSNTCTIDNGLTLLHLFHQNNALFRDYLLMHEDSDPYTTLSTAVKLMYEGNFVQAKIVWARLTTLTSTDLFGEESDFMMSHFNGYWKTRTVSECTSAECPEPLRESRIHSGFDTSTAERVENVQAIVDKWIRCDTPCAAIRNAETPSATMECNAVRHEKKIVEQAGPVVAIRVYETCLYDNLTFDNLLASQFVDINGNTYQLSGITMYREGHFCAIPLMNGVQYWYDGLKGRLVGVPRNIQNRFFPSYALYCQIS